MQAERLGGRLRVAREVEVGLERVDERRVRRVGEHREQARVQRPVAGVGREAGERAVGAELVPRRDAPEALDALGDGDRVARLAVGAARGGEVVRPADADARGHVQLLGARRLVDERQQPLRERARRDRRRVVERDEEDAVVGLAQLHAAARRDDAAQPVERGADGELDGRAIVRPRVGAQHEHGDPARVEEALVDERARRRLGLAAVVGEQVHQQPALAAALELAQPPLAVQHVGRRARRRLRLRRSARSDSDSSGSTMKR